MLSCEQRRAGHRWHTRRATDGWEATECRERNKMGQILIYQMCGLCQYM
jgi:hypothetical protein